MIPIHPHCHCALEQQTKVKFGHILDELTADLAQREKATTTYICTLVQFLNSIELSGNLNREEKAHRTITHK